MEIEAGKGWKRKSETRGINEEDERKERIMAKDWRGRRDFKSYER